MTVGELIQKYGIEYIGRFYSIYRGVVLDNQDSDNIGKLLIIIPSIHDGVKVWARPYNNPGSINSGVKWLIPRVGDIVWVQFEMESFGGRQSDCCPTLLRSEVQLPFPARMFALPPSHLH